jgi:hypothetical protein
MLTHRFSVHYLYELICCKFFYWKPVTTDCYITGNIILLRLATTSSHSHYQPGYLPHIIHMFTDHKICGYQTVYKITPPQRSGQQFSHLWLISQNRWDATTGHRSEN